MRRPPIYGFLICGHKTHGKTFFGETVLPSVLLSQDRSIRNISVTKQYSVSGFVTQLKSVNSVRCYAFADIIKIELCKSLGISIEELEENKENYRNDIFEFANKARLTDSDYYTKHVADSITGSEVENAVIITDFRQPEELEYLRKRFRNTEWITIKIIDPSKPILTDDRMEIMLEGFYTDVTLTRNL
jgi:hypothetical protein